jgi:hypothetical protein
MICNSCGHERTHHIQVYSSERCWYSFDDDDKMCDCTRFEERTKWNAIYQAKKNPNQLIIPLFVEIAITIWPM